jgi:UDP-3-O-[3-hydroxymyristoyl] glucosamine N-acyltransferase
MSNTWKQYGGIRKQEKFHNLTIGTLVADQVLLRESYAGKFRIPGSIYVGADTYTIGNTYSYTNTYTTFDNFVGKNNYIKNLLYFGTDTSINDLDVYNHAYICGDFSANTIGINTITPTHALDIKGIDSKTDILSISSNTAQVRSVLGKNITNDGITLNVTHANAILGFYIDTSLNYANTPNAQLRYTIGGNMYYNSKNNNIVSTANTVITASGSTFINSQTLMNITAGQSVSVNTTNTNILSRLYISNRGQPTNIFNESTIINDISNGLYLYDAYENTNSKAGSALTMVATDNSSNTFLRLITPNKAGLYISAGTYPNDQKRTINAYGITDNSGIYRVNQTVVTGNSLTKYYASTGFNTYAPRTENYVMDINGPTHISNGEINKMTEMDFEIFQTSFSKMNKQFGITVGSPSPTFIRNNIRIYPQNISYTSDGGSTWTPVRIGENTGFEVISRNLKIFVYDSNYSILVGNSYIYYTLNGGKTWTLTDLRDPVNADLTRNIIAVYIGEYNGNVKRVFLVYTLTGSLQMNVNYFDINFTNIAPYLDANNRIFNFSLFRPSINTINIIDGYDGVVYFVGTGINKYQISSVTSQYVINTDQIYYGIQCYSTTYAVAVGANIISYTYDGTNWTNIVLSTTPIGNVTLRSVYLFDTNIGMAVGDNGTFLYTNNGAQTWAVVPNSILNSSGYASRINGSYNNLRHIFMSDSNTMSISSVKNRYVINTVGTTISSVTPGLSKIYTCYIPNLYNRATNKIFDVSGNMEISGDININDGGNLITNNTTFNLINNNASTVNFAGDANTINIGNVIAGNTYLRHNFDVSGNVSMHRNVTIDNNLYVSGDLSLNGKSDIGGNLKVGGNLNVTNKAVFNSDIHIKGNIEHDLDFKFFNRLYVENDTYLYQRVFVGGDVSLNGNVYIGGPLYISTTITPNSNTIILNNPTPIQSSQSLEIGTLVSYFQSPYGWIIPVGTKITNISSIDSITGNVVVNNIDIGSGNVAIGSVINGLTITLDTTISAAGFTTPITNAQVSYENSKIFSVYQDTSLNSRLYVGGDTSLNGRLSVSKDVSLNGNIMMYNSRSYMKLTPNAITYNYSTNPNFPIYQDLSFSQFQYIKTLTQSVQEVLNTITSKTGPIGITNTREFTPLIPVNRDFTDSDINNLTANLISNTEQINTNTFGVTDTTTYSGSRDTTLLTFDVGNNNVLVAGNLVPISPANINFGTDIMPYGSIYLYNENAINFIGNQSGNLLQGGLTFNTTTGYLDISYNGLNGSTVLSYNGNVAIGKPTPTTTLDVLGTTLFNGNITQQTGNLSLNNRLFVGSDISLGGNLFSNRNLFQKGDTTLNARLFAQGDVSLNSNLFVLRDVSLNNRIYVGGDTSLNANLFVANRVNIIGDLSLNRRLNIRGDVSLNSGLYVANETFLNGDLSLNGNVNIDGFAFFNNDEYLKGNLFVTGDQFLNGKITINGTTRQTSDVTMTSRLFVSRDVSLNGKLYAANVAIFNNFVQMNNSVNILNNLSLNGNLSIGGDKLILDGDSSMNGNLSLRRNLLTMGDVSFNGNLYVNARTINNSDVFVGNRLFINNDASFNSDLFVNNKFTANNDSLLNGNVTITRILTASGDLFARNRLFVNRDVSLNGNLYVNRFTILNNDISVNGNIAISNALVRSDIYINGNTILYNDASLNANLIVGGDTIINGNIRSLGSLITNDTINNGTLLNIGDISTNGNINISSNLLVNRNTNLRGNVSISGTTNIGGTLVLASDLSINGRLNVANYAIGSIPIGAISGGAGLALGSFSNDVNIGKNFYVGGDTTLYGNLTVVQDLLLIGNLAVKQYSVNQTITTVSYELLIAQDLSVNGRVFLMDDVSMNKRLFVDGDVSFGSNLFVEGRTTFAQPITIGNTLTINGNVINNGQATNNTLSIFNADVSLNNRLFVLGGSNFINDVSMNTRLYVARDVSMGSNLFVNSRTTLNGDVSMNTRLYLQNDASMGSNLFVNSRTTLNGDVSINTRLYVQNDASMGSNLFVNSRTTLNGDVSMNTRLYVQNDASMTSNLFVNSRTTLNGDVSMNSRLYVANDASMGSNLFVNSRTTLNGDVSMNSRLYVQNDASMGSNLFVNSRTILNGDVSMNRRLYVQNDASVNGNFYVGGKTIYNNDASFNKFLYGTDASFTGNVAIYGNLYLQTDLRFDNLFVKEIFNATNNVYITGQSTQMVDASLNGNLNVNLDSSLNGRLAVARDVSFNRNINVLLDSSLNGNLLVGKNVIINGNTKNIGDVSMVSSLDLNGQMIARDNMNVYGIINQYSTVATPQNTIVNNTSYVTSNASQVTLGTTSSQSVYVPGNIGIGTTSPSVPLFVNKSVSSTGQADGYYFDNTGATIKPNSTNTPYNYSIYAINSIGTADKIVASSAIYFSDERIKTNIENIDTETALEKIRKIEPKKYEYIDTVGKGSEPTWGFVAQQVKNVLEYTVSTSKNFIPDIYELCEVVDEKTIRLNNKTTDKFTVSSSLKAMSKNHCELFFSIKEILDDKTFSINEFIDRDDIFENKLFIYGQEIDDFNNLDKNAIFTITTAALKQVDKELQYTKTIVQDQKTRIEKLEQQIKIINDKLQFF